VGYASYLARRLVVLGLTLVIATYITVLIANYGGYIDVILRAQIEYEVSSELAKSPAFKALPEEEQRKMIEEMVNMRIVAAGLDKPFFERSLLYLVQALTLDLGKAMFLHSAAGSYKVADIILERLPWTVVLFVTGTLISAIIGLYLGLVMGRKSLSIFDRSLTMFAILTSVIPPWFFGVISLLIFSFWLGLFPHGGIIGRIHEEFLPWLLDFLHHLTLPLMVWVFTYFGYWAYVTRNLVIYILHEDYVMAARAKGLPSGVVMRKYVLRPAAPPIITMIALAVIWSVMGAIITETVFGWRGVGLLFAEAIFNMDAPVIIGLTVMFAYLLISTVFTLDVVYGFLDPRIKVGAR